MSYKSFHSISLLLVLAVVAVADGEDVTYSVRDLGTLGGANSRAYAINEQGWVVGEAETKEGHLRAFLWTPDIGMRDLGTCGGDTSRAYAINERGQVAGEAEDEEGRVQPFLWSGEGGLKDVPLPAGFREGYVFDLNNFGVLVGGGEGDVGTRALVWTVDGVSVPEALRKRGASLAYAVNDVGDIAGQVEFNPEGDYVSHAFVMGVNGMKTLIDPDSTEWSSAALALSGAGVAVGYAELSNATHAVRIVAGAPTEDLDTLANVYSVAHDINEDGVAVGLFVSSHEDDDRAFCSSAGTMTDLNELLETDEPWLIVEARGINKSGEIVGYGLLGERERAVLLTPRAGGAEVRPQVRIVEPAADRQFWEGNTVSMEASVEANGKAVRRVTFFSSGVVLGSVTSAPYRLEWRNPPPGPHHLVAAVVSSDGLIRRSPRVPMQVQIRDVADPAVALLEPNDGTALALGDELRIAAEIVSENARPLAIRLLLDGQEVGATNGFFIGYDWKPTQTGLYTWVSVATDLQGVTAESAPARVNVTTVDDL
ncbi:MAG: hypothetical protein J5I99_05185 [Verrucomicrobia bacterium]|nr:Ig-like domain-containing protein [Kiritimatiellia bacterium]MCO6400608.1 hypothetical protein [Verrucomicrobiota bacterium]